MTLTVDNLASLMQGRQASILSRTFQDTFVVARRFNVRYVWIDSLCIIQEGDGYADWAVESAKMDQVYSNAYVTVLAGWAESSNEGLFFDRDLQTLNSFHARATFTDPSLRGEARPTHYVAHLDLISSEVTGLARNEWRNEVISAPLNSRGWVFQELILSSRILHFARSQVFWECRSCKRSERLPSNEPPNSRGGLSSLNFSNYNSCGRDSLEDQWCSMIEKYQRLHSTKDSDRLVAISGVAKRCQEVGSTL